MLLNNQVIKTAATANWPQKTPKGTKLVNFPDIYLKFGMVVTESHPHKTFAEKFTNNYLKWF